METLASVSGMGPPSRPELGAGETDRSPSRGYSFRNDLSETHDQLNRLKKMNEFLEAENTDLRRRLLSQLDRYPDATETRQLARHYGSRLAKDFADVIDENKYLKVKLQSAQRAEARAEVTASNLADALRSETERGFARSIAADRCDPYALEGGAGDSGRVSSALRRVQDAPLPQALLRDGKHVRLRAEASEHCLCTEKLQELLDSLDENLKSYERNVWQMQVNVLEDERNELSMKVVALRQRLADVQARIMGDPFLASKYAEATGAGGRVPATQLQLREAAAKLALAEDVNTELERRLAFERNISRSWQSNLRAMQRELRDHLADLAVASRSSGMRCDLFRGEILQAGQAAAHSAVGAIPYAERESLRLLRQARDRIEADAKRLEVYSSRISDLETEVKDLRISNSSLEAGMTRLYAREKEPAGAGFSLASLSSPLSMSGTPARAGDVFQSGLLVARQVLADRLVCTHALRDIERRRTELQTEKQRHPRRFVVAGFAARSARADLAEAGELFASERRRREEERERRRRRRRAKAEALRDEEARSEPNEEDVEEAEAIRVRLPPSALSLDKDRELVRQVELLRRLAGGEEKFRFPRVPLVPEQAEAEAEKRKRQKKESRFVDRGFTERGGHVGASREDTPEGDDAASSYRFSPELRERMGEEEGAVRQAAEDIKDKLCQQEALKAERQRLRLEMERETQMMAREIERERSAMMRHLEDERQRRRAEIEEEERLRRERAREREKEEEAYWREREERRRRDEEEDEQRRRERERRFMEEEEERERRRAQRLREEEEERQLRAEWRKRVEEEDQKRRQNGDERDKDRHAQGRTTDGREEEEARRRRQREEEEAEWKRKQRLKEEEEAESLRKQRLQEEEEEEKRRKRRLQKEEEEAERRRKQRLQEEEEEERRRKQRLQEEEEEAERRRKQRLQEEEEEERRREQRLQEEEEEAEKRRKRRLQEEEEERRRKQRLQEEEEEELRRKQRLQEEEEEAERRRKQRLQEEEEEAERRRKQRLQEEEEEAERRRKQRLQQEEEAERQRKQRQREEEEAERKRKQKQVEEEEAECLRKQKEEEEKRQKQLEQQKEEADRAAKAQAEKAQESHSTANGTQETQTTVPDSSPLAPRASPQKPSTASGRFREVTAKVRAIAFFERVRKQERPVTVGRTEVNRSSPPRAIVAPAAPPTGQTSPSSMVSTAAATSGEDEESSESETEASGRQDSPRTALRDKLYDKYNNLANAFKHMDKEGTAVVSLRQFADFLDESGLDFPFATVHDLYRQLSQPANVLTEPLMYRNMEGEASLTQLDKRLEDIFGNTSVPFEQEGIEANGRVPEDVFVRVAGKAGLTPDNAKKLWKQMDVLKSGHLQLENVLLLLEDNVELSEVRRVEEEVSRSEGGFLNLFGATPVAPSPQPKVGRHQTYGRPMALTRKLAMGFTEAQAAVDDILESNTPWDILLPATRLEMIKKMTKVLYEPEERIQEANDPNCPFYVLVSGTVQLLTPGLLMESVAGEKTAPTVLFGEEMVEDRANSEAVKALTKVKAFVFSREEFNSGIKELEMERRKKVEEYMGLIKIVPVLNKLVGGLARRLARSFEEQTFQDGEPIIREFDEPDNFYLVKQGEAAVVKYMKVPGSEEREETVVRLYQSGDYFGEISIIKNQTRTATIKAKGECTVLSLPKADFNAQLRKFEADFIRRAGRVYTAKGHFEKGKKKPKTPEVQPTSVVEPDDTQSAGSSAERCDSSDDETKAKLIEDILTTEQMKMRDECMLLLEAVPVLKDLPLERREKIMRAMTLECFFPNTPIILQGEEPHSFYVLKTGTCAAELWVGPGKPFRKLKEYNSACYFGEMSIIKDEPRGCYVVAKSPVQLYALTGEHFKDLLGDCYPAFIEYAQAQYEQETTKRQESLASISSERESAQPTVDSADIMKLLVKVPVINMLSTSELEALTHAFKVESYQEREVIIHEGEAAEKFYIIYSGSVSVQKVVGDAHQEIVVLNEGEYLGEIAFLNEQPRTASCVAKTDVQLLSLTREDFKAHLGALADAFLTQAESKYSGSKQEEIPEWLVEAGEQGAFYDPNAPRKDDDDDVPTSSFRGTVDLDKEKEMYNKKKERKNSSSKTKKSDAEAGTAARASAGGESEKGADAGAEETRRQAEADAASEGEGEEKKKKKKKGKGSDEEKLEKDETNKAASTKTQAKRRMSLAGGAALLAAAAAAKAAGGEPQDGDSEEKDKAPEATEKKKEEKRGKKKKKSKDKDEDNDRDREAEATQVAEIRALVRGTLKNKYGSIAQAFQQIDGNHSDNVDFDEFAAFVKDLRVQSLRKKDIQALFDDLCQPLKGTLTVANLYRNIDKKDNLTKAEINLRWVDIFGSSRKAFKAVVNLSARDDCTAENFIKVAAAAGVSEENAMSIWKELDKLQKGSMQTKIICGYMTGELTVDEAAAKEEEHSSIGSRFLNFFGGGDSDDEAEKSKNSTTQGDEEKIKEALKWEDMAIVQRDDHRAYPSCTKRMVDGLENQEGFSYLQLLQLRYVASLMKRECMTQGTRVVEAGDEACMVWCAWGGFKIVQAGFFGESETGTVGPDEFFGLSELVNDTPISASLVTEVDNSILWVLERDTYHDLIKDILDARRAVVPIIENFLTSVPIIKDMTKEEIGKVARACKIETFSPHQTVFRAGSAGDMFCFIFEGEITMLKPMGAGQEPIELGRLQAGIYFGEMGVIKNQRRTASIIAATELTLFCLDKGSFEKVLGRVKGKMIERAESMYKRQDVSTTDPKENEETSARASPSAPAGPGSAAGPAGAEGDQFVKKRTRKSSLALLQYAKIREGGSGEGEGEKKSPSGTGGTSGEEEEEKESRWAMAEDPQTIHHPPPPDAMPKKSAIRTSSNKSVGIKNSVFFDEATLLPSPPSSDEEEG
ncbi:cyclic nucleotide-binding domain-containing protein [Besnoitia besnoiti]|uniref:Cyclic nucleotide-binding domain-containing protein n=1 Tax=Besnoitia besnoiti TaxID=94643 RepID=A0A2A9MG84_BESBE|nr:cyclic nucleotide-binding domain-containing protein [Besnoitia besnoiti]PFH37518.1 cyclic nucleotide-binding domain-containing protein [Besnoitia besnoiti]